MSFESNDSVLLLNTAIIKNKEKRIERSYEKRLSEVCTTPALEALGQAINYLSEKEKISRDQAAVEIIDAVKRLDAIWGDYIMMEGVEKLKKLLKDR